MYKEIKTNVDIYYRHDFLYVYCVDNRYNSTLGLTAAINNSLPKLIEEFGELPKFIIESFPETHELDCNLPIFKIIVEKEYKKYIKIIARIIVDELQSITSYMNRYEEFHNKLLKIKNKDTAFIPKYVSSDIVDINDIASIFWCSSIKSDLPVMTEIAKSYTFNNQAIYLEEQPENLYTLSEHDYKTHIDHINLDNKFKLMIISPLEQVKMKLFFSALSVNNSKYIVDNLFEKYYFNGIIKKDVIKIRERELNVYPLFEFENETIDIFDKVFPIKKGNTDEKSIVV
jgi:hypothetical protein